MRNIFALVGLLIFVLVYTLFGLFVAHVLESTAFWLTLMTSYPH